MLIPLKLTNRPWNEIAYYSMNKDIYKKKMYR